MSFKTELVASIVEAEKEFSPVKGGTEVFTYQKRDVPCVATKLNAFTVIESDGNKSVANFRLFVRRDNLQGDVQFHPKTDLIISFRGDRFRILQTSESATRSHYELIISQES